MLWTVILAGLLAPGARTLATGSAEQGNRSGAAEPMPTETLYKIRSAFVLQLVRFTRWSDDRFEQPDAPIVIGIPRGAPIGPYLAGTVRGRTIGDREIRIRELDLAPPPAGGVAEAEADAPRIDASIRGCHLIYVPGEVPRQLRRAWTAARGRGVLLVGDDAAMIEHGATIALPVRERRVHLVVHRAALRESKVELSSRVLKLAEVIEDPLPDERVAERRPSADAIPEEAIVDGGDGDGAAPTDGSGGGR